MKLVMAVIIMALGICSVLASSNSSQMSESGSTKSPPAGTGPGPGV